MSNPISNNMDNEHKKEWPPHFWLKLNTEETRVLDMVEQEMPSPHKEYLSLTEHQAQITSLEAMLEEKQKRIEVLEAALEKYKNISCSVQNIDMAAREALAASAEVKDE